MNSNYKLIVAFILFYITPILATRADVIDDVSALLKTGNSKQLAVYFAPSVEMTLLAEEEEYTKVQAEAALKAFFAKYPPSSVKLVHKITSNPNHAFVVFALGTANGNFRTSISLKNNSGKFLITEMRIEKEE